MQGPRQDMNHVPDNHVRMKELELWRQAASEGLELTLTGNYQINDGIDPSYLYINPNGSDRDVRLPQPRKGMLYFIMHVGSANTITVKDYDGTTLTYIDATNVALTTGLFVTVHRTVKPDGTRQWRAMA